MKQKKTPASEIVRRVAMIILAVIFVCAAVYLIWLVVESRNVSKASQEAVDRFLIPVTDSVLEKPDLSQSEGEEEEELVIEPEFTVDFDALWAISPNVVGWITVAGIEKLNYPLVQYSDNDYYLSHTWDDVYNRYGAVFVDAACAGDFSEPYVIMYGHNMKDGSMFGGLKKYRDQDFYDEYGGIVTIYLPEETRIYQIFSIHVVSPTDPGTYTIGFTHGSTFDSFVKAMTTKSEITTGLSVNGYDDVITLSTCSGSNRLVANAKLISRSPVSIPYLEDD